MQSPYQAALNDLYSNKKEIFSVSYIEWWLLKYGELYESVEKDFKNAYTTPYNTTTNQDVISFVDAYRSLDELCEYHRMEPQYIAAIEEYTLLEDKIFDATNAALLSWILKYEKLMSGDILLFVCWYTSPEDTESANLSVSHVEFKVDRKDFKNTFAFLDLMDIYWKNFDCIAELFPLSLAAQQKVAMKNSYIANDNKVPF